MDQFIYYANGRDGISFHCIILLDHRYPAIPAMDVFLYRNWNEQLNDLPRIPAN
jgi:hypothetical protein